MKAILSGERNEVVVLPIHPAAGADLRNQAEAVRAIWAVQEGRDGDGVAAQHIEATGAAIDLPCRTLADVSVKLAVALHELSPCTDGDTGALAFDPGDLPTQNAAPLLVATLNDLLALAQQGDDMVIEHAWSAYRAARAAFDVAEDDEELVDYQTETQRQLSLSMNAAASAVRGTVAKTPRGIEIQLWLALADGLLSWCENVEAALSEDFDAVAAVCDDKALIAAIRSLRAMQGRTA